MKAIFFFFLLFTISFASLIDIKSFDADFKQTVSDEKGTKLLYKGHIRALSPKYALWEYKTPVPKSIFVRPTRITIIEPEIEQAIVRKLSIDFDFFKMITHAEEISKHNYIATINETKYLIKIKNKLIDSIVYKDEFDNSISIFFTNQVQNKPISKNIFTPLIPKGYDIIDE
ncbi:MAG: LolA-like outer membrane lipoprotein chaperone [Sulfurimonas sp.]